MHKSGVISSTCDDLFNAIFFAESFRTTDKLDLNAVFCSEMFGIGTDFVAQRFGKTSEVEYLDVVLVKIEAHSVLVAPAGNRTSDNDAVEAGVTSGNLLGITSL